MGMLNSILAESNQDERRARLSAFWKVWTRDQEELRGAVRVRFYSDTVSSIPEDESKLLKREFIYEFVPTSELASARQGGYNKLR